MDKIMNQTDYESVKKQVESLMSEATAKGMLEPDMDNEYTHEIASLSAQMAKYEDEQMDIMPLRQKNPLIITLENYFYSHNIKQKECASMLGVNESAFSQIMNGKRHITMPLAKRMYKTLGIDAGVILEYC